MDSANATMSGCPALPAATGCSSTVAACVEGSRNAAAHRPRMPTSFAVVNTDCVPAPSFTPSPFTNVSSRIAAQPTGNSRA